MASPPHLLLLALALLPAPGRADSIRCDGGLVSVGDSKLDLLGKCGRPALVEAQDEERSRVQLDAAGRTASGRSTAVTVERWTYNFGPRQFVEYVTLESGRVTAVERGSYGYDLGQGREERPPIPRCRCDQLAFRVGDSTFDVLARCGEPAARDTKLVTVTTGSGGQAGAPYTAVSGTVLIEIWTYDLGPQVLARRLSFQDGKVVRIETGGYGYSRLETR